MSISSKEDARLLRRRLSEHENSLRRRKSLHDSLTPTPIDNEPIRQRRATSIMAESNEVDDTLVEKKLRRKKSGNTSSINRRRRATSDLHRRRSALSLTSTTDSALTSLSEHWSDAEQRQLTSSNDDTLARYFSAGADTTWMSPSLTRRRQPIEIMEDETDKEDEEEAAERELYRKTFLEPEEEGVEGNFSGKVGGRSKEVQLPENKILRGITYMALEHEYILQILMLLPLTLMALYIVVVEGGDLVIVKEP